MLRNKTYADDLERYEAWRRQVTWKGAGLLIVLGIVVVAAIVLWNG